MTRKEAWAARIVFVAALLVIATYGALFMAVV